MTAAAGVERAVDAQTKERVRVVQAAEPAAAHQPVRAQPLHNGNLLATAVSHLQHGSTP
jgi:hypothetical protein